MVIKVVNLLIEKILIPMLGLKTFYYFIIEHIIFNPKIRFSN